MQSDVNVRSCANVIEPVLKGEIRQYFGKRAVDLLGAVFALLIVGIPMAVVAVLVRVKLGSPVLFKQRRAGALGKTFVIYKFRTMTDAKDAHGALLPDDRRLTKFGRFLRSTSIDELPELFNILKGDMSFVGPRPLLTQYVERYSPEQARRLQAMPGLTGWAQVNGRNSVDWDARFKMDVWYVDHASLMLDMRVFFKTFGKVLGRSGISASGEATMSEFRGMPDSSRSEASSL